MEEDIAELDTNVRKSMQRNVIQMEVLKYFSIS